MTGQFENRPASDYAVARKKVDAEAWWCVPCNVRATELSSPQYECHTCSDWYGCGTNCSVYAVRCPQCGAEKTFR